MGKDFQLQVHDDRAEEYERIFGTSRVFVKSPIPDIVTLESTGEKQRVYMLDLAQYDDLTHNRLVAYIARKFNADEDDVTKELGKRGLPIQADNATLIVLHPMKWLPDETEEPAPKWENDISPDEYDDEGDE